MAGSKPACLQAQWVQIFGCAIPLSHPTLIKMTESGCKERGHRFPFWLTIHIINLNIEIMAKTFYGEQIETLKKALELCKDGGCDGAVPFIANRIRWMQKNDWELGIESNKPSNYAVRL